MHRWVFSKASLWSLELFFCFMLSEIVSYAVGENISISLKFNVLVSDSGKTSEQLEQLTLWQLPKNYHYIVEHKTLKPLLELDGFTPAKSRTWNNRIDSLAHFNAKAGKTGEELNFPIKSGIHYVLLSTSF